MKSGDKLWVSYFLIVYKKKYYKPIKNKK